LLSNLLILLSLDFVVKNLNIDCKGFLYSRFLLISWTYISQADLGKPDNKPYLISAFKCSSDKPSIVPGQRCGFYSSHKEILLSNSSKKPRFSSDTTFNASSFINSMLIVFLYAILL